MPLEMPLESHWKLLLRVILKRKVLQRRRMPDLFILLSLERRHHKTVSLKSLATADSSPTDHGTINHSEWLLPVQLIQGIVSPRNRRPALLWPLTRVASADGALGKPATRVGLCTVTKRGPVWRRVMGVHVGTASTRDWISAEPRISVAFPGIWAT